MSTKETSMHFWPLFILCSIFSTSVYSQLNFQSAYTVQYFDMIQNNNGFKDFNEKNDWFDDHYENVNFFHGAKIGLRQKIGIISLEAAYSIALAKSDGIWNDGLSGSPRGHVMHYRLNTFQLLTEAVVGRVGIGGGVNYNVLNVNSKFENVEKNKIVSDHKFGYQVHISILLSNNDNFGLWVRPFYKRGLKAFDITAVFSELELDITLLEYPIEEKMSIFGLSFIFSNGPQ